MLEFLLILAAWLGVNGLASRRVMAAGRELYVPVRLLLATIWLLPFVGAFMAVVHTPSLPKVLMDASASAPFSIGEHRQWAHGLPVLDWPALGAE